MTVFATGFLTCLGLTVAIGAQTLFLLRQIVRRDRVLLSLAVCFAGDVVMLSLGTAGAGVAADRWPWLATALTAAGVVYLLWFAVGAFRSAARGGRTLEAAAAEAGDDVAPSPADVVALTGQLPVIDPRGGLRAAEQARSTAPALRPEPVPGGGVGVATRAPAVRRVALGAAQTPVARVVLLALSVSLLNPHAFLDTVVMMGTFAQSHGAQKWVYSAGAMTASAVWFVVLGWGGTKLAPLMNSPRTWRIVDGAVGVLMLAIAVKVGLTLL